MNANKRIWRYVHTEWLPTSIDAVMIRRDNFDHWSAAITIAITNEELEMDEVISGFGSSRREAILSMQNAMTYLALGLNLAGMADTASHIESIEREIEHYEDHH